MASLKLPYYLIVGERPVYAAPEKDGGFDVLGYDWATTGFIRDNHAWDSLFDGGIDAAAVDEREFRARLKKLESVPAGKDVETFVFKRLKINVDERDEKGMLTMPAGVEKAKIEYNGDLSRLTNIVSSSMIFDSLDKLRAAPDVVAREFEIVRRTDRFERPLLDGYGCLLLNTRAPNGHICEMGLHLQPLLDAQERHAELYEELHSLGLTRLLEDRPFSPFEARRVSELLDELNAAYAAIIGKR